MYSIYAWWSNFLQPYLDVGSHILDITESDMMSCLYHDHDEMW